MEGRQLVIGGFYKHFKERCYQVKGIAYHSETKEKMVVYQALYGDFSLYVRPYDMFMSEVDKIKYPKVSQKYRFEQVELSGDGNLHTAGEELHTDKSDIADTEVSDKSVDSASDNEQVNPYLILFLDAKDYTEKLNVLALCKDKIDDKVIDTMAASMDIEVPDGTIEQRYASLRNCIRTHVRYEGSRLR